MAKCFFVNGTASWYGPDLTCLPIGTCIVYTARATRLTCHVSRLRAAPGDPARADHGPAQLHLLPLRDDLQLPAGLPGQPRPPIPAQFMPRVQVVGGATRICQADGTWTRGDLPTCIPVQCDIPHNPVNGEYEHFLSRV